MNKFSISFISILSFFTVLGCSVDNNLEVDNKSYINNFELNQENPNNSNKIRITSPKAVIDPLNNDVEISNGLIEIVSKNGQLIKVESGSTTLNNTDRSLKVFDNVYISLIDAENYFIKTNSFSWDLNTSIIILEDPLDINFDNTTINSLSGSYDLNLSQLEINDNIFTRSIYNDNGIMLYKIEILSDIVNWFKADNKLEFMSNKKQVETTINFLSTK